MDFEEIKKRYEEELKEREKRKSMAASISLGVFAVSFIALILIIKEPYNLTSSAIISISLALLIDKVLTKE